MAHAPIVTEFLVAGPSSLVFAVGDVVAELIFVARAADPATKHGVPVTEDEERVKSFIYLLPDHPGQPPASVLRDALVDWSPEDRTRLALEANGVAHSLRAASKKGPRDALGAIEFLLVPSGYSDRMMQLLCRRCVHPVWVQSLRV
jgi:hypothetical protein